MLLYHLTTYLNHNGKFEPRIPKNRRRDENATTARVCVATSLGGCLTALPKFGFYDDFMENCKRHFKLFCIDTAKLGIPKSEIIDNETLYINGEVHDACVTGEHWITCPFQVPIEDTFLVHIKDYELGPSIAVAPAEYAREAKQLGVEVFDYMDEIGEVDLMECLLVVTNLDYVISESIGYEDDKNYDTI